jgi:hypothetical protein
MRLIVAMVAIGLAGCGAGGSEPPRKLPSAEQVISKTEQAGPSIGSLAIVYHSQEQWHADSQFREWLNAAPEHDPHRDEFYAESVRQAEATGKDRLIGVNHTPPPPQLGDHARVVNDLGDLCTVRFETGPREGLTQPWPKKWLKPITPP